MPATWALPAGKPHGLHADDVGAQLNRAGRRVQATAAGAHHADVALVVPVGRHGPGRDGRGVVGGERTGVVLAVGAVGGRGVGGGGRLAVSRPRSRRRPNCRCAPRRPRPARRRQGPAWQPRRRPRPSRSGSRGGKGHQRPWCSRPWLGLLSGWGKRWRRHRSLRRHLRRSASPRRQSSRCGGNFRLRERVGHGLLHPGRRNGGPGDGVDIGTLGRLDHLGVPPVADGLVARRGSGSPPPGSSPGR